MNSSNLIPVDDARFDELVLQSDLPVLLKFSTRQCGPCKALAPVVERVADEVKGRWRVFSIDLDEAPRIAARYGIRAVPTLLAFRQGVPRGQLVGVASRQAILKLLG